MEPEIPSQITTSQIDWPSFLVINEQLLGIEDFLHNLLKTISYQELTLNIMKYKPNLFLNENVLYGLLVTAPSNNRLKVYELMKLISKNYELFKKLLLLNVWKKIYEKRITHSKSLQSKDEFFSDEFENLFERNMKIICKLCVFNEYYLLRTNIRYLSEINDTFLSTLLDKTAQQLINNELQVIGPKYAGRLLIDDDIRRLCISKHAFFTLNNENIITEYFLDKDYEEIDYRDEKFSSLSEEEILKLSMQQKHLSDSQIFHNVKEMLNIDCIYDYFNIQFNVQERETLNATAILTYNGELFFHAMLNNISYTLKFDMKYMKKTFNFDKVLNIQINEIYVSIKEFIIIETEDHSLFSMNVRILFNQMFDEYFSRIKQCIELIDAHPEEDNHHEIQILNEMNLELFISKDITKPHKITQIVIEDYFSREDNFFEENSYQPFMQVVSSKKFLKEDEITFNQKIHIKSSRTFTMLNTFDGKQIIFYYDCFHSHLGKEELRKIDQKGSLYMMFVLQEIDEEENYTYHKTEINLTEINSNLSWNNVTELTINKYEDKFPISRPDRERKTTYGKVELCIKCDDTKYYFDIVPEIESTFRNLRCITIDDIVDCVKETVVKESPLKNCEVDLYEDYTKTNYVVDSRKQFSFTETFDSGTKHTDFEENVSSLIHYSAEDRKDKDLMIKISPNNIIYVPHEYYQLEKDNISKQLVLVNGDILFRKKNCSYNFKVILN